MIYERCGQKYDVKKPEYSFTATAILIAYRTIERGRKSNGCGVSPLSVEDVLAYESLYDLPCDRDLFAECIFTIDNEYLTELSKEMKKKPSK